MFIRVTLVLASLVATAGSAAADTPLASVRGTIVDSGRAPVDGASILLVHEETNGRRQATADALGGYAFPSLSPGAYRLEVEQGRFKKHIQRFELSVNQQIQLDVQLTLGALTETVEVTAPRLQLRRDSPALATVVPSELVSALPLDGRNFLELALLVPGAAPPAQGSAGSVRNTVALNVNGAREDANGFVLDGVVNYDPTLNGSGVRPPVDAIREFEVQTGTYDASVGNFAGGHVNVVTRAGTNRLTGTAYDFFRNGALDGRNAFAPENEPAPDYRRNQLGVAVGGPIRRDRTFFFADFESTRGKEGITRVTNVPTATRTRRRLLAVALRAAGHPGTGLPVPRRRDPGVVPESGGPQHRQSLSAPQPHRRVPELRVLAEPDR